MSRVPITPPSSSTGTLNAAQIPSLSNTWANLSQSGSVWMLRMAADSRWLNATAQGPWASRSWWSSRVWAVWSEALAQRSWPSASISISPAASARNSRLAPSVTCCKVRARPRSGSRLPRAPMLLARSVGSMGMTLPAFRACRGLANRSAGQGAGAEGAERANRPSPAGRFYRARARSLRCHCPGGDDANTDIADYCTPAVSWLKPVAASPTDCVRSRWLPGSCSLGQGTAAIGPVAAGRLAQTLSACIPRPRLPPPRALRERRPIVWWRGSELLASESSRFALVQDVPAWPVVAVRSAASSLECGPTSGVKAGNGCETAHVKTPDRGQPSGPIGRLQLAETLNRKAGETSRTRGVKEGGN